MLQNDIILNNKIIKQSFFSLVHAEFLVLDLTQHSFISVHPSSELIQKNKSSTGVDTSMGQSAQGWRTPLKGHSLDN